MSVMYLGNDITEINIECDDTLSATSTKPLSTKGFTQLYNEIVASGTIGSGSGTEWQAGVTEDRKFVSTASKADFVITFPKKFSSVPKVICSIENPNAPTNGIGSVGLYMRVRSIYSVSTTGFTLKVECISGSGYSTTMANANPLPFRFNWFAIV